MTLYHQATTEINQVIVTIYLCLCGKIPQFHFENYATERQASKGPSMEIHLMQPNDFL